MTLSTRRLIIAGLSAGAGLAAAGSTSPSSAAAAEFSYDFSSVIFSGQLSDKSDFFTPRWRDNRSGPEFYASYDWGVFTRDTHSVDNGVGHVLQHERATPLKSFQDRFNKESTLRCVSQTFVTTQGLFSLAYGSLEVRARFPQSAEGLFAGIWLWADDDDNGGEIDVVETYGGGNAIGVAGPAMHYGQAGSEGGNPGVSPRLDLTQ